MSNGDLKVVIVGGGRVGSRVAQTLDSRGHNVTIVEGDSNRVDSIADKYVATVIEGDATKPSILKQTGLQDADVLAALTADAGTNLAACLTAERYGEPIHTVMRRTDEEESDGYEELVDTTIFPERAGARAAVNAIDAGVRALEDMVGALEILVIEVSPEAPAANRPLTDIALPRGSLVVSGSDGETIASGDTVIDPEREYVVATEPDVADEVRRLFRG